MKVDLVMWAKNGAWCLPRVLARAEQVIPNECVLKRIFIDDGSTDNSRDIAEEFNWSVYGNRSGTPAGATNEALRRVTLPFFISIEQDLYLAKDWWEKIPTYMDDESVAVAQGVRVYSHAIARVLNLDYVTAESLPKGFRFGRIPPSGFMSLDNNLFRTSVVRDLGGFPVRHWMIVDWYLGQDLANKTNFRWVVDPTVVSLHLRSGVRDYFRHEHRMIVMLGPKNVIDTVGTRGMLAMTVASPIRGLQLAINKRHPHAAIFYPYRRLVHLHAYILRRKRLRELSQR